MRVPLPEPQGASSGRRPGCCEPGGTLALSDFVIAEAGAGDRVERRGALGLGEWFGRSAAPLTPAGYERLGRACGFEVILDDDVTPRTLPTYPALRRLYRESGTPEGVATIDAVEDAGAGRRLAVPRAGVPAAGGPAVNCMAYVESALAHMEEGGPPPFWRHFHWGLFADPERDDDSPERYFAAAEAMTDHVIAVGEVRDGTRVLDVGCGFGGTLDHLRSRAPALPAGRAQHRRAPAALGAPAAGRRGPAWRRPRSWPPTAAVCRWPTDRSTTCWRWSACSTSRAAGRSSGRRPGCCGRRALWRCRTS